MENGPTGELSGETNPKAERKAIRGNPLVRLGFFSIFLLTLPFTWGQTAGCDGPAKTYTGFEKLVVEPNGLELLRIILVFFGPILLGFVAQYVRPHWARIGSEFIATMLAGFSAFICVLMAIFSGDVVHKHGTPYPAPFIASFAMFSIVVHAFRSAMSRVNELLIERRASKQTPKNQ